MKAAASHPLAQPPGSIIPIPRYRLKSRSSGQAADTTGPSQTKPPDHLSAAAKPRGCDKQPHLRVIEIIETSPDRIEVAREQLDQILDCNDLDALTPLEVIAAVTLVRPFTTSKGVVVRADKGPLAIPFRPFGGQPGKTNLIVSLGSTDPRSVSRRG
jgi:hypothetical protein